MWGCIVGMKVSGDCVLAADIGMSLVLFDDLIPDLGTIDVRLNVTYSSMRTNRLALLACHNSNIGH
jgi:hypothetical protein